MNSLQLNLALLALLLVATACHHVTPPVSSEVTAQKYGSAVEEAVKKDKPEGTRVEWLSIEEAAERMKQEPRKVLVDVYTDWCGWCKKMDKETFTDPQVAKLINEHFYAVKLDAEGEPPITLNGKTYSYKPEYRSHELAVALLQGQMSYPTTVYLDEHMNMLARVPGYLDAKTLTKILRYFGENHHKSMNFQEYEKAL